MSFESKYSEVSKANYSKAVPVQSSDDKSNMAGARNSKHHIVDRSVHYTRQFIQVLLVLAAVVGCLALVGNSSEAIQQELFKALSIALGLCILAILSANQNQ